MGNLTIGRVAKKAGVHIETIRYYQRRGLIVQPPKCANGYRVYPQDTVSRIRFIKRAQGLGFTLKEILDLLSLKSEANATCGDVRKRARGKIVEIEKKIKILQKMRKELERLVPDCHDANPVDECPILESLGGKTSDEGKRS